jgi:probable F420-dependent oxidoreductase
MAKAAESAGFSAVWTNETQHEAFLPHALIAEHTKRLGHGTAVAIAFARSPGALAYTAWDLASSSGGRFMLGLGTQVKPHVERRFGLPWPDSPVGQLREMIGGLRALWSSWQSGERLNFRGDRYRLTLMTPFFNPGPIEHPDIPIYLAGVNTGLCRLAGEVAQGFHAHPLHSADYLTEVVKPAIAEGADKGGRDPAAVKLVVTAFVVTDPDQADDVRSQIAFYASTPSYRPVMALHGWEETAESLSALARRGAWDEMARLIDDDMLATFAVVSPTQDLAQALRARYAGVADRLMLYRPFSADDVDTFWAPLVEAMAEP